MTFTAPEIGSLVLRVQGAFLDRPALRVTLPQAEQEFGMDNSTCDAVLGALVDAHVLTRRNDGAYLRHFPRQAHAA